MSAVPAKSGFSAAAGPVLGADRTVLLSAGRVDRRSVRHGLVGQNIPPGDRDRGGRAALSAGDPAHQTVLSPPVPGRIQRLLPLAAFNNVVVGVALVINHQVQVGAAAAVGLALGSCLGFLLLSWLTAEGMERLDNPDMPAAFRGLPATLVYLGILALALMGFTPAFALL